MNKLLFVEIFICLCVVSSCRHNTHEQEQSRIDSLRIDSIKKTEKRTDSLSLIAWGDAKFGMSEKELSATKAFKGGYWGRMSSDEVWSIRRVYGLEALHNIYAEFKEDELWKIFMESYRVSIREFDDLVNDCVVLTKEFTKKYGKPTYLKKDISPSELFSDNKDIAIFNIGSKEISIFMFENNLEYGYKVLIYNSSFPRKKHEPTEEEIKKKKEQEAKDKETLENSL